MTEMTGALKGFVALLIGKDGYTCSNDIAGEVDLHNKLNKGIQDAVDHVRERNPDWSEDRLREYAFENQVSPIYLKVRECLESQGYDMSSLPTITVPEFLPGVGALVMAAGMGSLLAYRKWKARKSA